MLRPERDPLRLPLAAALILVWAVAPVLADDWPMWRHDARRSAATAEELPAELHLQWVRELPEPQPAWPGQPRLHFDLAYQPIVLGKRLIVGSNASDRVTAYSTDTGQELWRFYADGPIRLAPAAWNGKVYVACDDGYLYCLDAATGKMAWRFRGGLTDRKVLGNERMISIWPARTGPVVQDGIVYSSASIWPFMGVFIYALDAETGKVLWRNDSTGSMYILQPHNSPAFAGLAPQGYLALSGDRLLVPNGRSVPAALTRETGDFLYYRHAEGKRIGNYHVTATDSHYINTGMIFNAADGAIVAGINADPIVDGDTLFFTVGGKLHALVLASPAVERSVDPHGRERTKTMFPQALEFDCQAQVHIKAGKRLYAGAKNLVQVIEIEKEDKGEEGLAKTEGGKVEDEGEELLDDLETLGEEEEEKGTGDVPDSLLPELPVVPAASGPVGPPPPPFTYTAKLGAQIEIHGTPSGLIAADGKLFVVTQEHRLYCFGGGEAGTGSFDLPAEKTKPPNDEWTQKAATILERSEANEGYCLALGLGSGRLVEELARQSQLRIVVAEPDEAKIAAMRLRFDHAGLYGARLHILNGELASALLPPYFASLIVAEDLPPALEAGEGALLRKLYGWLRPYGGTALLPADGDQRSALMAAATTAKLPSAEARQDGEFARLARVGALPGSADWTHQYADASNTVFSKDRLVKAPLGLLWFGGSTNERILPRHGHGPTPQVAGGRLFIEGIDILRAKDVYTGRILWEADLPELGDPHNFTGHQPGANSLGSNYVSLSDGVYVVYKGKCLRLDPATGRTVSELALPPDPVTRETPLWGYIGIRDDVLVAGSNPLDLWNVYFTPDEFARATPEQLVAYRGIIDGLQGFEVLEQEPVVAVVAPPDQAAGAEPVPQTPMPAIKIIDGLKIPEEVAGPTADGDSAEAEAEAVPEDLEALEALEAKTPDTPPSLPGGPATPTVAKEAPTVIPPTPEELAKRGKEIAFLVWNLNKLISQETPESHVPQEVRSNADAFQVSSVKRTMRLALLRKQDEYHAGRRIRELKRRLLETWYPELPRKRGGPLGRYSFDATASKRLVAMDRHTGDLLWAYEAEHSIRHNAIAIGGGKLFLIDKLPGPVVEAARRRGREVSGQAGIVALDLRTGRELWRADENIFGTWLGYSEEHDILVQAGRRSRDMLRDEPGERMIAYRARDGSVLWDEPHRYGGPVILDHETIIAQGNAFDLRTGALKMRKSPFDGKETPWSFRRNYGCNTAIASEHLLTFRSAAAGYYDLRTDSGTGNFGGFKSSCTSNLVVANGVLNAPDYTRTCLCSYQNQSSLALIHMPEVDTWTFSSLQSVGRVVRKLGVNLGAPGDRLADDRTMWLEYPIVGGPSPPIPIRTDPAELQFFRFHPSRIEGDGLKWVAASGVKGVSSLVLRLYPPDSPVEPQPYTVRLHFVEPDGLAPGERVFDVAINGAVMLDDLDIAREAGGAHRALAREFTGVPVDKHLTVTFTPSDPVSGKPPVLAGIEVHAEFGQELKHTDEPVTAAKDAYCFVPEWRVSNISRPTGGEHWGLADELREEATETVHSLETGPRGFFDLKKVWDFLKLEDKLGNGFQCIAESWVFSPLPRSLQMGLGPDYWGLVWVNDEKCLEVIENRGAVRPNAHVAEAALKQGWNRVRVRLASGSGGMGFWFSIFQHGELQFAAGEKRPPWPTEWSLTPVAGTFVSEKARERQTSFAEKNVLYLSGRDGSKRRALLRWPRERPPAGINPDQVDAQILLTRAWHEGEGQVWIRPVLVPWDEAQTNFEHQPRMGKPIPIKVGATEEKWVFEGAAINSLVRNWLSRPEDNHGIAIESDVPVYAAFFSDNEERAPKLILKR